MSGMIGTVDKVLAQEQWDTLIEVYKQIGFDVQIISGVEGLPDMVFCAIKHFPLLMSLDGLESFFPKWHHHIV